MSDDDDKIIHLKRRPTLAETLKVVVKHAFESGGIQAILEREAEMRKAGFKPPFIFSIEPDGKITTDIQRPPLITILGDQQTEKQSISHAWTEADRAFFRGVASYLNRDKNTPDTKHLETSKRTTAQGAAAFLARKDI